MAVRPVTTQISLGIRPVWWASSLSAQWVAEDPSFLHADSKDADQTGQMPRLIYMGCRFTIYSLLMDIQNSFLDIHNSFLDIQKWI